MIDLTNKNIDINSLINKYSPIIYQFKKYEDYTQLAFVFDYSINYINEKYPNLDKNWKAWCLFVIKEIFKTKKFEKEKDVENLINAFVLFYEEKYKSYLNYIETYVDEYFRDIVFVSMFTKKQL